MSRERDQFEAEVRKPRPDWTVAIDRLNSLAMFEMLPALSGLNRDQLNDVLGQARRILNTERHWYGAFDRVEFAAFVVVNQSVPDNVSLPADQLDDARRFLLNRLRRSPSRAGTVAFPTMDTAAIAAIDEIGSASRAINREFSGSIFQRGASFSFTAPEQGGATDSNPNVPVPHGTTVVASYHTHGNSQGGGAELASGEDIMISIRLRRISYIGTPAGHIKKIIPRDLLPRDQQRLAPLGVTQQTLR